MIQDYPNVTVTFLIEFNRRFLITARASDRSNFPDLWAFPGGKVEIGETVIQTIRREVKEETNLDLRDEVAFLDSYWFRRTVGLAFMVRAQHDRVRLSEELTDHRWIGSLSELSSLKCVPGIHNHLVRALSTSRRGVFDTLNDLDLTEQKYLNR